jgi:hypothetical protein
VILGLLLVGLILGALSGYVAFLIVDDLRAAKATLTGSTSDLSKEELDSTIGHLRSVSDSLDKPAAQPLDFVPVVRQNLGALDSVVDSSIPALEDARALSDEIDKIEHTGFLKDGVIDTGKLESLSPALAGQAASLGDLRVALEENIGGWLLPPMWDALDTLLDKTKDLQRTAERADLGVATAAAMLDESEDRSFLVLLLNNAELRGAGGILSAVGTLDIADGRISLGDFDYYSDLKAMLPDRTKVPAPDDLERRFSRYWADTSLWVNTSASPDVPEVALTARNLYERTTGKRTDGAIIIDPRGLAALMPEDETIEVPESDIQLTQPELTDFIYSESYNVFSDAGPARREAVLTLGPPILRSFLHQRLERDALERLDNAISGQHLRVVSFDKEEQSALASLDVSGELSSEATDTSFFTVQNLGADKLDFWMERNVEHGCRLSGEGTAACQSRITLMNQAPKGLPSYVTQDKQPYGLYKGYLEAYVPEDARIETVTIDGESPEYFVEVEDGRQSLGAYFSTRRGQETLVELTYSLSFDDPYTLEVSTQALAHDAAVRVVIVAPDDWTIETPDGATGSVVEYEGTLNGTLRFEATERERPGLTGAWDRIVRFWNDPVF